jgi:hypothetical protein
VAASQSRIVWSLAPDAIVFPSGERAALQTIPVWPVIRRLSFWVARSQRRTVRSRLPVRTTFPSGEKATE